MDNKVKIPCGGFYIGDGLTMDGNTLKISGGSLIVTIVDDTHASHTSAEIYEAFQSGKTVQLDMTDFVLQLASTANNMAIFSCTVLMNDVVQNFSVTVSDTAEIKVSVSKLYPAT